jgi:hypothetical protein
MPYQKQINYFYIKTTNYLSKQTCYGQILQKHSWVIFIASHANHFSMPTTSVIVATTSQNLMVFIKYLVTVFHFWVKHLGNFLSG